MADGHDDDRLREMAAHRGLKLVRSRRRKAGLGDYGHYGLRDAKTDAPVLGIGADGLTATADDIAEHLRGAAASSWQQSAATTPDRQKRAPAEPAVRRPAAKVEPEKPLATKPRAIRPPSDPVRKAAPKAAAPSPPPEPSLVIRQARASDAAAIAALLQAIGITPDEAPLARHIAAQARSREPLLVADRGGVIGCIGWHAIPTAHRGLVGRITLIVVAAKRRREGIGGMLLDEAVKAMTVRRCALIEAISDIEIRNAHGFFRAAGFAETSYRFARLLAPDQPATASRRKQASA